MKYALTLAAFEVASFGGAAFALYNTSDKFDHTEHTALLFLGLVQIGLFFTKVEFMRGLICPKEKRMKDTERGV